MLFLYDAHDALMLLAELFILFKLHAILRHTDRYADHTILDTPAIVQAADAKRKAILLSINHTILFVETQAQKLSDFRVTRFYLLVY